jgi:hypothetical protein
MDIATDGRACANSLSGEHEAYRIAFLKTDDVIGKTFAARVDPLAHEHGPVYVTHTVQRAYAFRITCAMCGVPRLDDFAIVPNAGGVMFRNMTGRKVFATLDDVQYEFTADVTAESPVTIVKYTGT